MSKFKAPALSPAEMRERLQDELTFLQRQERFIASNILMYKQETKGFLDKQEKQQTLLEREKYDLELTLKTLRSRSNAIRDLVENEDIRRILNNLEKCKDDNEKKKRELNTLESMSKRYQKELDVWKFSMIGCTDKLPRLLRTNAILDNRLYAANVKNNKITDENRKLRKEVFDLLKERELFKRIVDGLVSQIENAKVTVNTKVEEILLNFGGADENDARLKGLQTRAKNDYRARSGEMNQLNRLFDNCTSMADFMERNSKKRGLVSVQVRDARKRERQKIESEERLFAYEELLETMKDFKKEECLDTILLRFIMREDINHGIYKYVNIINSEIQLLDGRLWNIRTDIDNERTVHKYRKENQTEKLTKLNGKLMARGMDTLRVQERVDETNATMSVLLEGIEELFLILQCDAMPLANMLGGYSHVTLENHTTFLKTIENRINDYLNVMLFIGVPAPPPTKPKKVAFEHAPSLAPSLAPSGMLQDDEGDVVVPRTRTEIKSYVEYTLEHKDQPCIGEEEEEHHENTLL